MDKAEEAHLERLRRRAGSECWKIVAKHPGRPMVRGVRWLARMTDGGDVTDHDDDYAGPFNSLNELERYLDGERGKVTKPFGRLNSARLRDAS
jgi:hypothetical protein